MGTTTPEKDPFSGRWVIAPTGSDAGTGSFRLKRLPSNQKTYWDHLFWGVVLRSLAATWAWLILKLLTLV